MNALFDGLRLQWLCKKIGFERLILKGGKLRCYFLSDPQSSFYATEHFSKIHGICPKTWPTYGRFLKQTDKELILVQDDVRGIKAVKGLLEQLVGALN